MLISFTDASIAVNNLGGLGPDGRSTSEVASGDTVGDGASGDASLQYAATAARPEEIRLSGVGATATGRRIDMVISNQTAYKVASTGENGLKRTANGKH